MGRQSPTPSPQADSISLHTQRQPEYFDDEQPGPSQGRLQPDDLPPLYSDLEEGSTSVSAPLLAPPEHLLPSLPPQPSHPGNGWLAPRYSRDSNTGAEYYLDPQLSTSATALQNHISYWASIPPRQHVRIYGWHMEAEHRKGKKERKRVTDFDVWADLTPYLYKDAPARQSWRQLRAITSAEKTHRGTVLRTRSPNSSGGADPALAETTLTEWCHRYCASSAGLKSFRLQRRVVGLDTELLHRRLSNLRQSTNYRGNLEISFPVRDDIVEVYNPCRTNEWRLNAWIRWLFYLTLMFVFTWPYLFFRTLRFDVAMAEWPFSRVRQDGQKEYVSFSEDQWYGLWGRVIHNAVLEKRQGTVEPQEIAALDHSGPARFATGQAGVDNVLGYVAASVVAFGEVNRQGGWGFDTA